MKNEKIDQDFKPLVAEPVHDEDLFNTLYQVFLMSNGNESQRQTSKLGSVSVFCKQDVQEVDTVHLDAVTVEPIQGSDLDRNELSLFPEYTSHAGERRSSLCWHEFPLSSDIKLQWHEGDTYPYRRMSIGFNTYTDEGTTLEPMDPFVCDEIPVMVPNIDNVTGSPVTDYDFSPKTAFHAGNGDVCQMVKNHFNPSLPSSFSSYSSYISSQSPQQWNPKQPTEQHQKPKEELHQIKHSIPIPPVRALSAYNYFFRNEREQILLENDCVPSPPAQVSYSRERQDKILHEHWKQDRNAKRRHRKSHGKISFTDLSRLVSQRWKLLPECHKDFYREIAARDLERYKIELKQFQEEGCGNQCNI